MAISDFLTDRSAVQFGRSNGPMSGVAQTVSNGIVEGVRNGISEFLSNPGGPQDQAITGYGQPADWGPLRDAFGNPSFSSPDFSNPKSWGEALAGAGTAASFMGVPGAGFVGNAIGTGIDQYNSNQGLAAKGLGTLGFGDYLEGFARNMLPDFIGRDWFGLENTGELALGKMDQGGWFDAWTEDDMQRGQAAYDAGYGSHTGVAFENTDADNDFGWGGDGNDSDDDSEGSAQGGRGDAAGGGWD